MKKRFIWQNPLVRSLVLGGWLAIGGAGCGQDAQGGREEPPAVAAVPADPIPVIVPSQYGYGVTISELEPLAVACFSSEIHERNLLPGQTIRSISGYVEYDGTSEHLAGLIRTRLWMMSSIVDESGELVEGLVREGPNVGEWELASARIYTEDGTTRHLYREPQP